MPEPLSPTSARVSPRSRVKETPFSASTGLAYSFAYFFVTPSSEFRYLWWTVLTAIISTLLFALHLYTHRAELRARRAASDDSNATSV